MAAWWSQQLPGWNLRFPHAVPIARAQEVVSDLKSGQARDLTMLSVALRELRGLG